MAYVLEFPAVPAPGAELHEYLERIRLLQSSRRFLGYKGSDKAEALPSVSTSKAGGAKEAEEKMKPQEDVDAAFKETVRRALEKMKVKDVPEKPSVDDQNKDFPNAPCRGVDAHERGSCGDDRELAGFTQRNEQADDKRLQSKQQLYFAVILYSTFVLALVRFLGVSRFCIYFTINLESDCVGYSVYSTSSSANLFRLCRKS